VALALLAAAVMKTTTLLFPVISCLLTLVGCAGAPATEGTQSNDQAVSTATPNPSSDDLFAKYCGAGIPHVNLDSDVMLNPVLHIRSNDRGLDVSMGTDPAGDVAALVSGVATGGHVFLDIAGRRADEQGFTVTVDTAAGETLDTIVAELHFAVRAETGMNASYSPAMHGVAEILAGGIDAPGLCSDVQQTNGK
jgi:hypothetical protein